VSDEVSSAPEVTVADRVAALEGAFALFVGYLMENWDSGLFAHFETRFTDPENDAAPIPPTVIEARKLLMEKIWEKRLNFIEFSGPP